MQEAARTQRERRGNTNGKVGCDWCDC